MFWIVLKREMLEYLKSSKLLIGICITIILMTTSTIININDYHQRNQDYLDAQQELKEDAFRVTLFRPPQALSTLVQGKDRKLGNQITINYLRIPLQTSGYMGEFASQHHRLLSGFDAVDFAFIVRIVLSLLVIFLAYNSISEEKSYGTLKLMLANKVPRDQILLGKFAGGIIIIIGSFLIALLISLLIIQFHPLISFTLNEWIRVFVMTGISALYLILFFSLSLFVSVSINRPPIALMTLLQIWIFLVIIYPNLGSIMAEHFYKLPKDEELRTMKEAAFQPYEEEYEKNREAFHNAILSGQRPSKEVSLKNVEFSALQTQLAYQVDQEFCNKLGDQVRLTRFITILSPAELYNHIMTRIAETSIEEHDRFMQGVYQHWLKYVDRFKLRYTDIKAFRETKSPDFSYPSESMTKSFNAVLPQFIVMFLMSVLFFVLAYIKFLRKDVR